MLDVWLISTIKNLYLYYFQVPGFPDWFNVVYEGDDDVYSAKLGEEYAVGDVVIKV